MKNVVFLACEGNEWNQGLREAKWEKNHRLFVKIHPKPWVILTQNILTKHRAPFPHTKSLTRSSFSHFNCSDSQRPEVTLQGKKNTHCTLQLEALNLFFFFFFSFCYVFYSSPRILSDQVMLTQLWHTFCSLLLPPELLGNVLIARSFLFPVQLWVADSSFKQPAPKCKPFAFKKKIN